MGQLDEAIRAHLELKRKHGASEEELHAEEQEALGPVRRETPGEQPGELESELESEFVAEGDVDAMEVLDEPALAAPHSLEEPLEDLAPEAFHEPPLVEPGFEPEEELDPADLMEPLETEALDPAETEALDPAETEALDPGTPPERAPAAGATPPRGFDAVEDPEAGEEEDVLEETPDFLQETPEHDRLWFEQKPPRDFDFDE